MTFESRIQTTPRVFQAERAREIKTGITWASGRSAELLQNTASCSPYLAGLIQSEGVWLEKAFQDPEAEIGLCLDAIRQLNTEELSSRLRLAKRRVAVLTALADIAGIWSLERVTAYLSDFASRSVDQILKCLVADEIGRGKIPGQKEQDIETAGGMVALAMGKMGAGELNYSSDIDLICLFDETRFDPNDYYEARATFIRVTRKMTALLSDTKSGGYVFRTDLRLRPDASVTPVCLSMETAERYYESVGRTWERAAYIKASACAGDIRAGQKFLSALQPFVWRKHLDFAAIQDAHDMRLRIRDHKGLAGPLRLEGHNMKLGRGGIREIEFFTQTRQLIAGGRDPSLRVKGTVQGLKALSVAGWVKEADQSALTDHYRFHRSIEHRLQMVRDAQTHDLPRSDEEFARLAAFYDRDITSLRSELQSRIEAVHDLTEGFFAPDAAPAVESKWGSEITDRWVTYPALRSARAQEIFSRLMPEILDRMQDASKPDEALAQFDAFLAGLPAGVQLFSLFEANPHLTDLLIEVASTSPALARYLSRNSSVLDAVLGGAFFADWPGKDGLCAELSGILSQTDDYETQLSQTRRWMKEWHFRIGVHHLRGLIDAKTSGSQYADLAEAVVSSLFPFVQVEFERKHGKLPDSAATVLGMGSLGAQQLNALSDLDLIMIYEADPNEVSNGKRSLGTRQYYARFTQSFITALTAPMADGDLYEVDMRLRPSGRQGPVATSFTSFASYQMKDAWTWEHLALTRARPVAGDPVLAKAIERVRRDILNAKASGITIAQDVTEMRQRLDEAKATGDPWDVKTGRGRLQDIELFAQTLALRAADSSGSTINQISAGVADGQISAAEGQTLIATVELMWKVQSAGRLLAGGILDPDLIGEGGRRLVLRETGFENMDALKLAIENLASLSNDVITNGLVAA